MAAKRRTIAKTVSLMLTPEQASKLSLAEQIGELSLIPRNPDDEEAAEWAEYTIDDLLADGDKNSREKEQGTSTRTSRRTRPRYEWLLERDSIEARRKAAVPHGNCRSARRSRSAVRRRDGQADPPEAATTPAAAGPTLEPSPDRQQRATTRRPRAADSDASKMLDEFPIDFDDTEVMNPRRGTGEPAM